jgi:acetyl-CoA carboxylase biotin carboxylase subunit
MFKKVLIANRGEIALRILRACKELGIEAVVVHSTADSESMAVKLADESVCIGGPLSKESYLNIPAILTAASITGCDAIHPGIGFLSEKAEFAQMVMDHGFTWIGPSPEIISKMGDKVVAKETAKKMGLPVVPGSDGAVKNIEDAKRIGTEMGFPVLLKAAAGGGGKGMKVALSVDDVEQAFQLASSESKAAFGDDTLYMEKYLTHPRHIEIQVLGDAHGNAIHLGERDCSIQRNHQKVIEEAPSPALNSEQRDYIGNLSAKVAAELGYCGLGTIEYLFEDGKFYFMEMNTRLQVEHPVTEMITGIDLVREQIRVASGAKLSYKQGDIEFHGHAIECRINAEHPETFAPSPGIIKESHFPGGLRVRVDSAIYDGYRVPQYYDSMVAKLIVEGMTRNECLMRLHRCLEEFVIEGIHTNIPLHEKIIAEPDFIDGNFDIHWLSKWLKAQEEKKAQAPEKAA